MNFENTIGDSHCGLSEELLKTIRHITFKWIELDEDKAFLDDEYSFSGNTNQLAEYADQYGHQELKNPLIINGEIFACFIRDYRFLADWDLRYFESETALNEFCISTIRAYNCKCSNVDEFE